MMPTVSSIGISRFSVKERLMLLILRPESDLPVSLAIRVPDGNGRRSWHMNRKIISNHGGHLGVRKRLLSTLSRFETKILLFFDPCQDAFQRCGQQVGRTSNHHDCGSGREVRSVRYDEARSGKDCTEKTGQKHHFDQTARVMAGSGCRQGE